MRIVVNDTEDKIVFRATVEGKPGPWVECLPGDGQPLPEGYEGAVVIVYKGKASIAVALIEGEEEAMSHEDMGKLGELQAIPMRGALNDDGSVESSDLDGKPGPT